MASVTDMLKINTIINITIISIIEINRNAKTDMMIFAGIFPLYKNDTIKNAADIPTAFSIP